MNNFNVLFLFFNDQMYAVLLPIVIFLLVYIRRGDVYDLHHSTLGMIVIIQPEQFL